jgi:DNA-directed RNA polymerase subunit K/omega
MPSKKKASTRAKAASVKKTKTSVVKPKSKTASVKSTKQIKSTNPKTKLILSRRKNKVSDADVDVVPMLDDDDDGYTLMEEEFFNDQNFKEFNNKIKFHVFDPEKYETELHKEITIVPPNYRRTSDVITKYEFTEVVSNRARQIENGSVIFTDIGNESNPIKMAELEIHKRMCPLSIRRMITTNMAEVWEVNDMICPY